MIELPLSWRTLLVEALDQYCDGVDETTTRDDVAEAMVEQAEEIAEQVHGVESETLLAQLEDSLEDGGRLVEAIAGGLEHDLEELTGRQLVEVLEALCEIDYLETDEDDEAAGFFDGGMDPEDF